MTNPSELNDWREDLRREMQTALKPLIEELKDVKHEMTNLQLSSVHRADVYDKAVMDEKMAALRTEIQQAHEAIRASKEFSWKVMGGLGSLLLIIATFAPHISFR